MAAANGYVEVLNFLLEQPDIKVNVEDKEGWTPFHAAVCWEEVERERRERERERGREGGRESYSLGIESRELHCLLTTLQFLALFSGVILLL